MDTPTFPQDVSSHDEGFTLIELMVVLLIIAILLAIAIPTFLGARNAANARATQSNLRNALSAEHIKWTADQLFATDLSVYEPSLSWLTAAPTTAGGRAVYAQTYAVTDSGGTLSYSAPTGTQADGVVVVGYSKDNDCYAVFQSNNASLDFTAYEQYSPTSNSCPAPSTLPSGPPTAQSAGNTPGSWASSF